MSKAEILAELPKLKADERTQVFERLCELQERDLLTGVGPTAEEKRLLDQALTGFERDGSPGSPWCEVLRQIQALVDRFVNIFDEAPGSFWAVCPRLPK